MPSGQLLHLRQLVSLPCTFVILLLLSLMRLLEVVWESQQNIRTPSSSGRQGSLQPAAAGMVPNSTVDGPRTLHRHKTRVAISGFARVKSQLRKRLQAAEGGKWAPTTRVSDPPGAANNKSTTFNWPLSMHHQRWLNTTADATGDFVDPSNGTSPFIVQQRMLWSAYIQNYLQVLKRRRVGSTVVTNTRVLDVGGTVCPNPSDSRHHLRVAMPEEHWSWGPRVNFAIRSFAPPWVCWTQNTTLIDADISIEHVDGASDLGRLVVAQRTRAKLGLPPLRYAIFQHSLGFIDAPIEQLISAWRGSLLTASFQDLSRWAVNGSSRFNFLSMPWGADEARFIPPPSGAARKRHVVVVGAASDDESHGIVLFAASHAGMRVRHIGSTANQLCDKCPWEFLENAPPDMLQILQSEIYRNGSLAKSSELPTSCVPLQALGWRPPCAFYTPLGFISDAQIVDELQAASYVSSLRKFEGFEIPGIEALFCGARPLVYDISTYHWYRDYAVVLPSGIADGDLFYALVDVFKQPPKPVSLDELTRLHAIFSWRHIVPAYFERLAQALEEVLQGDDEASLALRRFIGRRKSKTM